MRALIDGFIALTIVFSLPVPARANDPFMDGAKDVVEARKKEADAFADQLVQISFHQTMDNILGGVAELKSLSTQSTELRLAAEKLEQELMEFARQDTQAAARNKVELERALQTYYRLYRRMIDLTFKPASIVTIQAQIPQVLAMMASEFDNVCRTGKSHADFVGDIQKGPPPPRYKFLWDFYASNTGENTNANYSSFNYQHKDRENALKNVSGATGALFMVAANLALAGLGTAATVAAAAGGIGLVVVVVLAIISYFSSEAKAYKMMTKYVNAELYKHRNVPRSQYIAEKFKEGCQSYSEILRHVAQTVQTYLSGPEGEKAIRESLEKSKPEMEALNKTFAAAGEAKCRMQLALEYPTKKAQSNGKCSIEVGTDGKPIVTKDEAFLNRLREERFYDLHMAKMISHTIAETLTVDSDELRKVLNSVNLQPMLEAQTQAFSRLMAIVNNYQLLLEEKDPGSALVLQELRLTEAYEALNSKFTSLIAKGINLTFGKIEASDFERASASFNSQLANFLADNPNLVIGKRLKSRFELLLRLIKAKT